MSTASRYDIDRIRKQVKAKMASRPQDPNEFRPPKAKENETIEFKFYVLPPLSKDDLVAGGKATRDMDGVFCVKHGVHWVNQKPHACPRILNEEECEMCKTGFEFLNETEEKPKRRAIASQWLSTTSYMINIYFPPIDPNPAEIRGKVMFFNSPKTVFDQLYGALMLSSAGDADDPAAFGAFYDELAAFQYKLIIKKFGEYNDYKSSKFMANLGAHPIVVGKDKKVDIQAIQAILDSRHDLFTKIDPADPAKIHQLTQIMLGNVDSGDIKAVTPKDEEQPKAKPPAAEEARAKPPVQETKVVKEPEPVAAPDSADEPDEDDKEVAAILARMKKKNKDD